jgi:hypothetical protein
VLDERTLCWSDYASQEEQRQRSSNEVPARRERHNHSYQPQEAVQAIPTGKTPE